MIFYNRNKLSVIVTAIVVIAAIIYILYIKYCVYDKFYDVVTTILITIFSIIIGAMISIVLYNEQKHKEAENKKKELIKNLKAELKDIEMVLNSHGKLKINGFEFLITYIEPIIIKECAKSGLFRPILVENLLHLSRKIEFYNVHVNYLLSLLANSGGKHFEMLLSNNNSNIEKTREGILEGIKTIEENLKSMLVN